MNLGKKISLAAVLAILAAVGYGGYTIIKKSDLAALRSGDVALYAVARVIDGDTVELKDGDVVRLVGIDAPEEGECWYEESRTALRALVEGKEVELRKDVTDSDDFGRLLRYVIIPSPAEASAEAGSVDLLVDEYMVREGHAEPRSNPRDKLYYSLLVETRDQAMREKAGLWGACSDVAPSERTQADAPPPSAACTIKGNVSADGFGKTYFLPGCNNYAQVKIDPSRGEQYFCSESAAIDAEFVKARYCP